MNDLTLIDTIQEEIIRIYAEYALKNLREPKDRPVSGGKKIADRFFEVVRKNRVKYPGLFDYFEFHHELSFCSDEIMYFTAHLFLYRPYVNNPLADVVIFNGEETFPNLQNIPSKRYSMFANIVAEKLYNFWDRIGDLIASYFPGKIKPERIFFGTALDLIPQQFQESEHYQWLQNFRNTEYHQLNESRKQIVHYAGVDSQYRTEHLKTPQDRAEIERIHAQRVGLPEYYGAQIDYTLEGFDQTILLLEEMTVVLHTDIADV